VTASASSETMKHRRAASEREPPGHCVPARREQLRHHENLFRRHGNLPDLLER
jgi:hypothetical protein